LCKLHGCSNSTPFYIWGPIKDTAKWKVGETRDMQLGKMPKSAKVDVLSIRVVTFETMRQTFAMQANHET
jgi:hypothetical protein